MNRTNPLQPETRDLLRHDIRAALADILGGLELLDADNLNPFNAQQMARVRASARQLARLLDTVDDAAWSSAPPEHSALLPILEGIVDRWAGRAGAADIGFDADLGVPPDLTVAADPLTVERVIGNLLDNAFKHGGGTVTLSASDAAGQAIVAVADAGPGLSAGARDLLFQAGGRPSDAQAAGSGLGLYISRQLAEQAGGSLVVEDGPGGQGTTCTLRLPTGPGIIGEFAAAPQAVESLLADKRILLVEDNPTNRLVAGQMLKTLGARVTLAEDGETGARAIADGDFDLALIDIELPGKSGLDVIVEVRRNPDPKRAALPLLAFTAYALPHHRAMIETAGADGMITKPLGEIAEFGRMVAAHLRVAVPTMARDIDAGVLNRLRATLGEAAFSELQERLNEDLSAARHDLDKSLRDSNATQARRAAHALVAVAGAIGAHGLQRAAEALHSELHGEGETSPERSGALTKSLLEHLSLVEGFLRVSPLSKDAE